MRSNGCKMVVLVKGVVVVGRSHDRTGTHSPTPGAGNRRANHRTGHPLCWSRGETLVAASESQHSNLGYPCARTMGVKPAGRALGLCHVTRGSRAS